MADRPKSRFQWVVDLVVYAPVGLAVVAVEELPDLVARGRQRAERQLATARVIGKLAVSQGQRETERLVSSVTGGVRRPSRPVPPQRRGPPVSPTASPDSLGRTEPARPAAPATLAIPGYDALSASQVVQRLPGLTGAELEAVGIYEASHRGRKTILNRVGQLQTGT